MLKNIIIINMTLVMSLALSTPVMAGGFTDIGNGLIMKGNSGEDLLPGNTLNSSGWVDVGNGVTIEVRNGSGSSGGSPAIKSGGIVHVGNGSIVTVRSGNSEN